jgi:transposase
VHGWVGRKRAGTLRRSKKRQCPRYTPEERRATCEAFLRSGRTREEFAKLWGVSTPTLSVWLRRFEEGGAKALETRRVAGPGRPRTIGVEVREEIARTKRRFPDFGLRRVRDWLLRFHGIRVSTGTVKSALEERGIASARQDRCRRAEAGHSRVADDGRVAHGAAWGSARHRAADLGSRKCTYDFRALYGSRL